MSLAVKATKVFDIRLTAPSRSPSFDSLRSERLISRTRTSWKFQVISTAAVFARVPVGSARILSIRRMTSW